VISAFARILLGTLYFNISPSPFGAGIFFVPCSVALYFASICRLFVSGIYDYVSFRRSRCCFSLFIVSFEVCPLFSFVVCFK